MIRVHLAPEPSTFDAAVRQRGLRAIARLVGEKVPGSGRRPETTYPRREDIPSEDFPTYWREALPDLLTAYRRICAYTCLYSRKGIKSPLDPFEVEDGWFELELVDHQVIPGAGVQEPLRTQVQATIHILHLNDPNQRLAPFVARELRRQGKLHPADQVPPT